MKNKRNNLIIKTFFLTMLFLVFGIFGFAKTSLAVPSVSGVSGTISHGNSITISGSDFGIKNPAKPLMWDDGENATAGTFPSASPNSGSQVGYSDYQPEDIRDEYDIPETHEIHYRAIPYTAVNQAINGPHLRSTKLLVGGHWDPGLLNGDIPARDVDLTVATPSDFANRWFATWYYRTDPDWPTPCQSGNNEKISVYQAGIQAYSNSPYTNQYHYFDLATKSCTDAGYVTMKTMSSDSSPIGNAFVTSGSYSGDLPQTTTPWNYNMGIVPVERPAHSQRDQWVRYEQRISNDQGFDRFLIDNTDVWWGSDQPYFFTDVSEMAYAGIRSYNNAFRYFDDIYIDSTLSRVMLGDASVYTSCTILEPQPPTTWSSSSITVTVNQGALPDGTAYLFAFDADGNISSGYPVTLGETSDTTPPSAPSGLSVS